METGRHLVAGHREKVFVKFTENALALQMIIPIPDRLCVLSAPILWVCLMRKKQTKPSKPNEDQKRLASPGRLLAPV